MRTERGATMLEILFALVLVGVLATVTVTFSLTWTQRQAARSAIYHVQSYLQLARVQAVTRNQACMFVVDEDTGTIQVFDLMDPGDGTDDVELSNLDLSSTVGFDRPDLGSPITLALLSGSKYQATFEANGTVSAGTGGEIVLEAGEGYHRITLFGAGAVRVDRWDGTGWQTEM